MPFQVPAAIQSFYNRYPEALDVFVDEDGKSYINHYEQKALRDAEVAGKTLYEVADDLTYTQIYPDVPPQTLKTYSAQATAGGFTYCRVNLSTVNIAEPFSQTGNIQAAMEAAANAAAVGLESISVTDLEGIVTMTITTYAEATFRMGTTTLTLQP